MKLIFLVFIILNIVAADEVNNFDMCNKNIEDTCRTETSCCAEISETMNGKSIGAKYKICIPLGMDGSVPMLISDDTINDLKVKDFRGNFAYAVKQCGGGPAASAAKTLLWTTSVMVLTLV